MLGRRSLRAVRIASAIIFLSALFAAIDLGMNALYSLLPEINDGIMSRSMFIRLEAGWTREKFFNAFEASAWVTFALLVENAAVWLLPEKKEVTGQI